MSVVLLNPDQTDANLPLREALNQFRKHAGLDGKFAAAGLDSRTLLDQHDVIHVLFGLDTSFKQEAMTDYWTLFGTDARFVELRKYFDLPEQKELVAEFGWPKLIMSTILSIPNAIRIAVRSRNMKRKWVWNDYQRYLDVPVSDIRREYGIDNLRRQPV
ncbi:hypothetical protein [Parasphingorhabdus sp.]|uniref:hypothetical protein n=1 Tax=Parasphingorhabdus sp. TaxID=2709688 RepID=UPI00326669BA